MTSFQLYADGLQIVSSMLFEKHSTFHSLDLLNGFTCHTLGIIKKRKKKSLARKSLALILFSQLMYYYFKFLKITKNIFFTCSIGKENLHFLLLLLLQAYFKVSDQLSPENTYSMTSQTKLVITAGLYCALVFLSSCLLACCTERGIGLPI